MCLYNAWHVQVVSTPEVPKHYAKLTRNTDLREISVAC